MNIVQVLTVISMLESSGGKNFNHPQKNCHGWLGMSDIAIEDMAEKLGTQWNANDTLDHDKAFQMAAQYLSMYRKDDWTVIDILLFWRCGIKGMKTPSLKQLNYAMKGLMLYSDLMDGKDITK